MGEQKLAAKIARHFRWAKDPKVVLPLASVIPQLAQLLMDGHPTKSKEFKEKRIGEIARKFNVSSDDVREILSWVEPSYTK